MNIWIFTIFGFQIGNFWSHNFDLILFDFLWFHMHFKRLIIVLLCFYFFEQLNWTCDRSVKIFLVFIIINWFLNFLELELFLKGVSPDVLPLSLLTHLKSNNWKPRENLGGNLDRFLKYGIKFSLVFFKGLNSFSKICTCELHLFIVQVYEHKYINRGEQRRKELQIVITLWYTQ